MKNLLRLICLLTAIYCIYFPFSYFHKNADKKEVQLSHIFCESEEDAVKAKNEIDNGMSFEDAVKEFSKDDDSKNTEGDIGYYGQDGHLDKNIETAAFKLPLNAISEPVKSEHGWHILKVKDIIYFSDKKNFSVRYFYTQT